MILSDARDFVCQKCGWCCRNVNINVSYSDILRWAKDKRLDILSQISYIDNDDPQKRGFYIADTVTAPKKPCQFLLDGQCSIYETRPRACAEFPSAHSKDEKLEIQCPARDDFELPEHELHELKKEQGMDFIIAEDRKGRLLKILTNAREIMRLAEEIQEFGEDPTEPLWATGFVNNKTGWTRVGTTPWLSSQNQPTDYVWTATKKAQIGDWSFANTARPPTDTLNGVTLYVYGQSAGVSGDNTFYIYDGSTWYDVSLPALPTSWGWVNVSLNTWINTWTKVDAAQLYIAHANTTNRSDVDAAYLLVDYTAASKNFTATLTAASVTPATVLLPITRAMSGLVQSATVTPVNVLLPVSRAMVGQALAVTVTPDTVALDIATGADINFVATAGALSATPDTVLLPVSRAMAGLAQPATVTPDTVLLPVSRAMAGLAQPATVTPDSVGLDVAEQIFFQATATTATITPDSVLLPVAREMAGTAQADTVTPDTVSLDMAGLITFQAAADAVTVTPDTVLLPVAREMAGLAQAATVTPDNVNLPVSRVMAGLAQSATVTPDAVLLPVSREMAGLAQSVTITPDAVSLDIAGLITFQATVSAATITPDTILLPVSRAMAGSAQGNTTTPDNVILGISGQVSFQAIIGAVTTTPDTVLLPVQRQLTATAESLSNTSMPVLDIGTIWFLIATTTANSITPNNVYLKTGPGGNGHNQPRGIRKGMRINIR